MNGLSDFFLMHRIKWKRQYSTSQPRSQKALRLPSLSCITDAEESQLPGCEDTQAAQWRDAQKLSHGERLRPPANS